MPLAITFVFMRMGKPSLPPLFPSLFCPVVHFLLVISSRKHGGQPPRSLSLTLGAHPRAICGLTRRRSSCPKIRCSHLLVPQTCHNCFKIRVSQSLASKEQRLGFHVSNPALPASLAFEKRRIAWL